jgi:cyclic pyranopterin phosphate synthase
VPHKLIPKLPHKEILSYEEILRIIKVGVRLGISKVRITGGEPLVRKGVFDFLNQLTEIDGLLDVSLTTNGVLLKDNIDKIKSVGIKRINISVDTLNRKRFSQITGYDLFDKVWEGIELAQKMGFDPIKLNVVSKIGKLIPVEKDTNDGPAERFRFENSLGEIGLIRPISRHFCNTCNRLRLSANGQLRPCLLSDNQEDLKKLLRKGGSDDELAEVFFKVVRQKPSEHNLSVDNPPKVSAQMSTIGG